MLVSQHNFFVTFLHSIYFVCPWRSYPLELELEMVMSFPVWLLGTKLWCCARAVRILNTEASRCPAPVRGCCFVWTTLYS